MSWLHSLLITTVIGTGIGIVILLVSMITGESGFLMAGVLLMIFAILWFWVHRGLNDPELHDTHRMHRHH